MTIDPNHSLLVIIIVLFPLPFLSFPNNFKSDSAAGQAPLKYIIARSMQSRCMNLRSANRSIQCYCNDWDAKLARFNITDAKNFLK